MAPLRAISPSLISDLAELIERLPTENHSLLKELCRLLRRTAECVKTTKMPLSNLVLVFCPSLSMNPGLLKILVEVQDEIFIENADMEGPVDTQEKQEAIALRLLRPERIRKVSASDVKLARLPKLETDIRTTPSNSTTNDTVTAVNAADITTTTIHSTPLFPRATAIPLVDKAFIAPRINTVPGVRPRPSHTHKHSHSHSGSGSALGRGIGAVNSSTFASAIGVSRPKTVVGVPMSFAPASAPAAGLVQSGSAKTQGAPGSASNPVSVPAPTLSSMVETSAPDPVPVAFAIDASAEHEMGTKQDGNRDRDIEAPGPTPPTGQLLSIMSLTTTPTATATVTAMTTIMDVVSSGAVPPLLSSQNPDPAVDPVMAVTLLDNSPNVTTTPTTPTPVNGVGPLRLRSYTTSSGPSSLITSLPESPPELRLCPPPAAVEAVQVDDVDVDGEVEAGETGSVSESSDVTSVSSSSDVQDQDTDGTGAAGSVGRAARRRKSKPFPVISLQIDGGGTGMFMPLPTLSPAPSTGGGGSGGGHLQGHHRASWSEPSFSFADGSSGSSAGTQQQQQQMIRAHNTPIADLFRAASAEPLRSPALVPELGLGSVRARRPLPQPPISSASMTTTRTGIPLPWTGMPTPTSADILASFPVPANSNSNAMWRQQQQRISKPPRISIQDLSQLRRRSKEGEEAGGVGLVPASGASASRDRGNGSADDWAKSVLRAAAQVQEDDGTGVDDIPTGKVIDVRRIFEAS